MPSHSDEKIDFVLNGRVKLRHLAKGGLKASLDSVMVAAAVPGRAGDTVLDLGCGNGVVGLCVAARVPGVIVTGVDIQPSMIDLAMQNAALNNVQAAYHVADIRLWEPAVAFDHVVCNPPYLSAGTYTPSPDPHRAPAMGHDGQDTSLDDWLRIAKKSLRPGGMLTIIHRADHIHEVMLAMGKGMGYLTVIPLWPKMGAAAKRVIIQARKNRKGPTTFHPGLVLHQDDGTWTDAANNILRDGAGIYSV
jgi:tRNA1(Val) A37 N6-methylase TrmN6